MYLYIHLSDTSPAPKKVLTLFTYTSLAPKMPEIDGHRPILIYTFLKPEKDLYRAYTSLLGFSQLL